MKKATSMVFAAAALYTIACGCRSSGRIVYESKCQHYTVRDVGEGERAETAGDRTIRRRVALGIEHTDGRGTSTVDWVGEEHPDGAPFDSTWTFAERDTGRIWQVSRSEERGLYVYSDGVETHTRQTLPHRPLRRGEVPAASCEAAQVLIDGRVASLDAWYRMPFVERVPRDLLEAERAMWGVPRARAMRNHENHCYVYDCGNCCSLDTMPCCDPGGAPS